MENKGNSLAKISLFINVILIIAVIILFVKMPSGGNEVVNSNNDSKDSTLKLMPDDGQLNIGYFNADSLNANLLFVKDLESEMANAQAAAESKMKKKQGEIEAWQQKWAKKGQLLSSEQEQYMKEAQKMEQDAMMFEQEVQMNLGQDQERLMLTHIQRVSNFCKIYAQENNYDFILSYQIGQNLFYASPNFDVTKGLVNLMNEDYSSTFDNTNNTDGAE
jgi:Skp family chaperone for outer membrane proteins